MKLIDIVNLISKKDEFSVELYDDNNEMFYAYFVGPKSDDRSVLEREYDKEVIGIYAGTLSSIYYEKDIPTISIAIRHSLKEES